DSNEPRGEMTLVIAGNREDNLKPVESISISEQIELLEGEQGLSRSDAIKQAARSRGLSKREAYQLLLDEKESNKNEDIGLEFDRTRASGAGMYNCFIRRRSRSAFEKRRLRSRRHRRRLPVRRHAVEADRRGQQAQSDGIDPGRRDGRDHEEFRRRGSQVP